MRKTHLFYAILIRCCKTLDYKIMFSVIQTNSVIQSNHVNGGECNGLVQLSEIASQSSSQNYGSVGEKYTTPHEINENEMDEILTEEVRKLNVIWDTTCRGYKDQTKVKAAWKEVSTVSLE